MWLRLGFGVCDGRGLRLCLGRSFHVPTAAPSSRLCNILQSYIVDHGIYIYMYIYVCIYIYICIYVYIYICVHMISTILYKFIL